MADESPDNKPKDEAPKSETPPAAPVPPARTPLRQRLKAKFNKAAKSDVAQVLKETAEDLKSNNKERVGLAVATIIPGGWIAYYAHRHHKFKKGQADDGGDNDASPPESSPLPPPKNPAPPKP